MERAEYHRHSRARGRNDIRGVETCKAGRAGAHRPSEALDPTRSSDRGAADRAGARPYRATGAKTRRSRSRASRRRTSSLARLFHEKLSANAERRTPNAERRTPNAER
jgi:hypothetical protein